MAKREMFIYADENGNFNPDDVLEVVETLLTVLTFIGGQAALGVVRHGEGAGDLFRPHSLFFQYNTFVPADKEPEGTFAPQGQPEAEPEEQDAPEREPEPVLEG